MSEEALKADQVRDHIQRYAGMATPTSFDQKKWGAMLGWLNRYMVTDELRHLALGWLLALPGEDFGPISSNDLTPQQKHGISKWVGTWYNDDSSEWETRFTFEQECLNVLNAARYDYYKQMGQTTMDLPFEVDGEPVGVIAAAIEDPLWNPAPEDLEPPEGAVWCEWCHDVLSIPGEPCVQCVNLGADAPRKAPSPPPMKKPVTGVAI